MSIVNVSKQSHAVLVGGAVLSGDALRDYAVQKGLCHQCGVTKTHERAGGLLSRTKVPLTTLSPLGEYTVYKGYCLQPTCYTLQKAQELLGEIKKKKNRTKRRSKRTSVISRGLSFRSSKASLVSRSSKSFSSSSSTPSSCTSGRLVECAPTSNPIPEAEEEDEEEHATKSRGNPPVYESKKSLVSPVCTVLEQARRDRDIVQIIKILQETPTNDKQISQIALYHLRSIIMDELDENPQKMLLSEDSFKRLVSIFEQSFNDISFLNECIATIMTLVVLNNQYKAMIMNMGGIEILMRVLKADSVSIVAKESCCAAIESLSMMLNSRDMSKDRMETLVKGLTHQFNNDSKYCRLHVIRSLYFLLQDSTEDQWSFIRQYLFHHTPISILWNVVGDTTSSYSVSESAMYILWRLWTDEGDEPMTAVKSNLDAVLGQIEPDSPLPNHIIALRLLASISYDIQSNAVPHLAELIAKSICTSMETYANDQLLQEQGIYALYCLLHDSEEEFVSDVVLENIIDSIVRGMTTVNNLLLPQAIGCQVLMVLTYISEKTKEVVYSRNAPEAIFKAFALLAYTSTPPDDHITHIITDAIIQMSVNFHDLKKQIDAKFFVELNKLLKLGSSIPISATIIRVIANTLPEMVDAIKPRKPKRTFHLNLVCHLMKLMEDAKDSGSTVRDCISILQTLQKNLFFPSDKPDTGVLALGTKHFAMEFELAAVCAKVTEVMIHNKHNEFVVHSGCVALSSMISPLMSRKKCPSESFETADTEGGFSFRTLADKLNPLIVEIPNLFKDSAAVRAAVVHLVKIFLVAQTKGTDSQDDDHSWLRIAYRLSVDLMLESEIEEAIEYDTLDVLLAGAQHTEGDLEEVSTLCRRMVEKLEDEDLQIVLRASNYIALVVQDSHDVIFSLLQIEGLVKSVFACMEKHHESIKVQEYTCAIIAEIATLQDSVFIRKFLKKNNFMLVLKAMKTCIQNTRLVKSASSIVSFVVPEISDSKLTKLQPVIRDVVASAMEADHNNLDLLHTFSRMLVILCQRSTTFGDIANQYSQVMASFLLSNIDSKTLWKHFYQLLQVVNNNDLVTCDTAQAVVLGMMLWAEDLDIVHESVMTLRYLTNNSNQTDLLHTEKAEDALLNLMKVNTRHPDFLADAYAALNNMVVDNERGAVRRLNNRVLDFSVLLMKLYPMDDRLQKYTLLLLSNYMYSSRSQQMLSKESDKIVPLLLAAAENHPEHCQEQALSIFQRL